MESVRLRNLELKDAPFMLEWMQDSSIACFFRFDAENMTEESCRNYIERANHDSGSKHFAIVNGYDEYLGTISLKHIDTRKKEAEYAVSTRKKSHGTGVALLATKEILHIAFEELDLERVYLNVLQENHRANAFYLKAGFVFDYCEENAVVIKGEKKALNWYSISKKTYPEMNNGES